MQTVIRSRRNLEIGDSVEGRKILEKLVIAPNDDKLKRFGVYDYTVDMSEIISPPTKKVDGGTRIDMSSSPIVAFARFGRG